MARPAPPTDVIRVAISGTIFSHLWNNIFWVRVTTDGTRTINDLADLLDLMIARYNTDFLAHLGSDVTGLTADGVWQTGPTTALADSRNAAHSNSNGSCPEDAAVCALVDWKILHRYRGGKPRTYIPGPASASISDGSILSSGTRSDLAAGAVSFMAAINAHVGTHILTCELGTVSFFTAGGSTTRPPTYRTPPVFEPYVGSGVRRIIASQRRRILT